MSEVLFKSFLVELKADVVDIQTCTWRQFIVFIFSHLRQPLYLTLQSLSFLAFCVRDTHKDLVELSQGHNNDTGNQCDTESTTQQWETESLWHWVNDTAMRDGITVTRLVWIFQLQPCEAIKHTDSQTAYIQCPLLVLFVYSSLLTDLKLQICQCYYHKLGVISVE